MLARSKKIMQSARGEDCTARLIGVCNFNPETTVAAHVGRRRGMGVKAGDNMVIYACSSCHVEIDSHHKSKYADDILRAIEETQEKLIDKGIMVIK